jgi:hypothetical protein
MVAPVMTLFWISRLISSNGNGPTCSLPLA